MAAVFAFLYQKKQAVNQAANQPAGRENNNTSASSTGQEKSTAAEQKIKAIEDNTRRQIEQIVEQGKTATGGLTKEAAMKIEGTINRAIIEGAKLKTPEQVEADKRNQAEKDRLEQQINQQIKDKP